MTTFDKVKEIISHVLDINPEIVTGNLSIGDIDEWDSMGNLAIISAIEEQLGVEIPIEDLFELTSVSALVKEINKIYKCAD